MDYGLYPGAEPGAGLHLTFEPGLTLILGANGLGKTTLVTMLFRLLTGPSDITALVGGSDLGNASLRVTRLQGKRRRTFSERVADGAAGATATLVFEVGAQRVSVERSLRDLTLRSFAVGASNLEPDENRYQSEMARLANVSTFSDWILLLRYIVFYFEQRRSLVWDPSAQRHLLRILFLESDAAQDWTERERRILQADTRIRNLRAVTSSEEGALAKDESLASGEPETRQELGELEQEQEADGSSLDEIDSTLADLEAHHERARLHFLTLEQDRESLYRELERSELIAIGDQLPRQSESARYILAQLFTDYECLVCGREVPEFVRSMESRIREHICIMCGSHREDDESHVPIELTMERVSRSDAALQQIDRELEAARTTLDEAEDERSRAVARIRQLRTAIAERTARIDSLVQRLPPAEGELYERRQELASLRSRVAVLQGELDGMRKSFEQVVADANAAVGERTTRVQEVFERYAQDFLVEDCQLIWAPSPARLGQTGQRFPFPAFALELGGSDFSRTVRRSGPDDVSESQREFIDLSFRMALAEVATQGGATSLVMDAPESSLDAVFVGRAASVLGTFGQSEARNRLVVTSNLVAGELIPELLRKAAARGDRAGRVVDLLAIAKPTAAVAQFREEYQQAGEQLLERAEASD